MIKLKRVYERYNVTDGIRLLVDRLWPRGVRINTSNVDKWMKDVAPSNELRKWYAHDPKKWESFRKKYLKELEDNRAVDKLLDFLRSNDMVTFVYASKDEKHNSAIVLLEYVKKRLGG